MVLAGMIAGALIASALFVLAGFSLFGVKDRNMPPDGDADPAGLTAAAYIILEYIKDEDYAALSRVAHPDLGIVFSPYATVTLSANKCFSAAQIAAFGSDTNQYVWGVFDGSGEPIEMTPAEYFAKFVYRKCYSSAPLIGVNNIVRSGNALENITDVFPEIQFVEFHIPGAEVSPAADFEWCSLRLGFTEYDGKLWLTVITHSEWTT